MRLIIIVILCFISSSLLYSQNKEVITEIEVDTLYKEDQFYAGVTYNLLSNTPSNLSQSGFSSGFQAGFIKDIPINKKRNLSIGIGLGYSTDSFNQNMLIDKDSEGNFVYNIIDESINYSKNKFSTHMVELPLEFRWRTSNATDYKFWRVYTGFRLGYLISKNSKFKGDIGSIKHSKINDFNDFQYGLTISAGYNTWNVYLYYAINPIFTSSVKINNEAIDMRAIKLGVMFYIL